MTKEVFIPLNQTMDYIMVDFLALEKVEDVNEGFSDVMVIGLNGEEYKLHWDYYDSYYKGFVKNKAGKVIEGYIV
jgi:hypothetical protein